MSKFKKNGMVNTFKNAGKGVRLSVKAEKNVKIHIVMALLVILFAVILQMSLIKICV